MLNQFKSLKKEDKRSLNVYIPTSLHKKLRMIAAEQDTSMSKLVQYCIEDKLKDQLNQIN